MRKAWLIATTTYRQGIRSTTFLLLTFGIPLLMVIGGGVGILTTIEARFRQWAMWTRPGNWQGLRRSL